MKTRNALASALGHGGLSTVSVGKDNLGDDISLHDRLVLRAERWLVSVGCSCVIRSPFRAITAEQPDAIGWREGLSVLVEIKTSRSDFFADRKKSFRRDQQGMGSWRFYLTPPDLVSIDEVPEGWGLIWATPSRVIHTVGVPPNTLWFNAPFIPNDAAEKVLLASALRRVAKNGRLPIYG